MEGKRVIDRMGLAGKEKRKSIGRKSVPPERSLTVPNTINPSLTFCRRFPGRAWYHIGRAGPIG